ncbi:MAG: transporter [Clostridium sp.]
MQNLNKKFIIEQCRNIQVMDKEESDKLRQEDEESNKPLIIHNDGHKKLIEDFMNFLNGTQNEDKKGVKKWLKKNIEKANNIVEKVDTKYNDFENDEVMNEEDEIIYYINEGVICMAYRLIDIIDKKSYVSKLK